MSDGFRELGLRDEIIEAATARGYDAPTTLQRATVPVLRRGGNAVLHTSYGAGVTAAYGLALLDRIADDAATGAPRVLIVTPTGARAASAADELSALAAVVEVQVRALAPGWHDAESADIVVGALENVAGAIGRSALKLEGLQAIVVESLSTQLADDGRSALDGVLAAVPRTAQRVVVTAVADAEVERFIEAHVRKPMHIPARAADRASGSTNTSGGEAHYLVVAEHAKDDAVARLLVRSADENVLVTTRSARRAAQVRERLDARGYTPGESGALRVQS
ncbi:MAG: DEAD/DEAH box helicase, partial [Longimicrobiales bacterium]